MPTGIRARWMSGLLIAIALTTACGGRGCFSSSSSPASRSGPPRLATTADLTAAEQKYGVAPTESNAVTYQPDVVIVGGGAESVRSMGGDGLTWTIDASAARAGELAPGKIAFVTNRVVGRILGMQNRGGTIALTLGPVEITDVIRDADLHIDQPISLDDALTYTAPDSPGAETPTSPMAGVMQPAVPFAPVPLLASFPTAISAPRARPAVFVSAPSVAYGEMRYLRTAGGPEVNLLKFKVTPTASSSGIGVKMTSDSGGMYFLGQVMVHLAKPKLSFDLKISSGKIQRALVRLDGAAGLTLKFEASAGKKFDANLNERVMLPMDFSIPILGLPVPLAVTVRQEFILKTAFSGTTGLSATGDYTFTGSFSAGYDNGKWDVSGPVGLSVKQSLIKSISGVSLAPSGLVLAHQAKVIVGIGAFGFCTGPYFGFNSSIGVSRSGDTAAMLIMCRGATLTIGLAAGIGYSIPQPVTAAINFFLRALNQKEIKGSGGIETNPINIVNTSTTEPNVKGCTG